MEFYNLYVHIALIVVSVLLLIGGVTHWREHHQKEKKLVERVEKAQTLFSQAPDKAKPAWDLARLTLDAYFQRNLSQVASIFWLSACVMAVGFGTVIWGVAHAMVPNPAESESQKTITPESLAALAGIITQFIGVSFLLIYRSVVQQAANYSQTLERINSVGMAMQIMDTMPDETRANDLKTLTKAKLVDLLVRQAYEGPPTDPNATKAYTVLSPSLELPLSGSELPFPVSSSNLTPSNLLSKALNKPSPSTLLAESSLDTTPMSTSDTTNTSSATTTTDTPADTTTDETQDADSDLSASSRR